MAAGQSADEGGAANYTALHTLIIFQREDGVTTEKQVVGACSKRNLNVK